MTLPSISKIANVVELHHGQPMVSSRTIAELFERRHDHVLRSIRRVKEANSRLPIREETSFDSQGREQRLVRLAIRHRTKLLSA